MYADERSLTWLQCFGSEAASTAEDYCVLESGAWTLSLVVVPEEIAATPHVTEPPGDAPVKLAFGIPDIDDLRSIVAGLGGEVDPRNTQWDSRALDIATVSTQRATSHSF